MHTLHSDRNSLATYAILRAIDSLGLRRNGPSSEIINLAQDFFNQASRHWYNQQPRPVFISRLFARDDQGIDRKGATTFRQDEKRIDVDAFDPFRIFMCEYG